MGLVERATPKDLGGSDPVCPVCLEWIKPTDKVRGLRDDLMHEVCDYTRPEGAPGTRRTRVIEGR
jgi:hypothetical protein